MYNILAEADGYAYSSYSLYQLSSDEYFRFFPCFCFILNRTATDEKT